VWGSQRRRPRRWTTTSVWSVNGVKRPAQRSCTASVRRRTTSPSKCLCPSLCFCWRKNKTGFQQASLWNHPQWWGCEVSKVKLGFRKNKESRYCKCSWEKKKIISNNKNSCPVAECNPEQSCEQALKLCNKLIWWEINTKSCCVEKSFLPYFLENHNLDLFLLNGILPSFLHSWLLIKMYLSMNHTDGQCKVKVTSQVKVPLTFTGSTSAVTAVRTGTTAAVWASCRARPTTSTNTCVHNVSRRRTPWRSSRRSPTRTSRACGESCGPYR